MNRRRTWILVCLAFAALVGFVVLVATTAPPPSAPDFTAASRAREATASESPFPAAASSDPCHHGGATYCVLNGAVTQATIRSTICVSGWTATIRPPESYTERLKLQQIASEGLVGTPGDYEEDHRMPLELGGDPSDPMNLSPESHATSYAKDAAENAARGQVCAGADLRSVQSAFVEAWLGPYPTYAR